MEKTNNRLMLKHITEAHDIKALEELEETLLNIEGRVDDERYLGEVKAFRKAVQKRVDLLLK